MTHSLFPRVLFGLTALGATLLVLSALPYSTQADMLFRQLDQGMSGADVSTLQRFLAQDSTIYPQGLVTGFFGPLTFSAVSNFQSRNGIATVGRVGPITLSAINRLSGSAGNNTGGSSDRSAPVISTINLMVASSSAAIGWTTNELTQSTLYYSSSRLILTENTVAGSATVSVSGIVVVSANSGLASSHSISVPNLVADTEYFYVIHATDQAGNVSVTWPTAFRTSR